MNTSSDSQLKKLDQPEPLSWRGKIALGFAVIVAVSAIIFGLNEFDKYQTREDLKADAKNQALIEAAEASRNRTAEQIRTRLAALGYPAESWGIDYNGSIVGPVGGCSLEGHVLDNGDLLFYPRLQHEDDNPAPLVNLTYQQLIERLPSMGFGYCLEPSGTS